MALSTEAQEVIWLKTLAGDVGLVISGIVCLNEDIKTEIEMAQEAKLAKVSKQIAIYYHFIPRKVEQGNIILQNSVRGQSGGCTD